jgi:hypothetical protein
MDPSALAEHFRQFAFVASLLGGFSFAFFGTLLAVPREQRLADPAAALALGASTCFLLVTLSNTFAASLANAPRQRARLAAVLAQQSPISMVFLLGIVLLLVSFGLAGWTRSRALGWTTVAIAAVGGIGVVWVMTPFIIHT